MQLVYFSQEGERRVCEIVLTEDDLVSMQDEISRTLDKLNRLKPVGERLLELQEGQE